MSKFSIVFAMIVAFTCDLGVNAQTANQYPLSTGLLCARCAQIQAKKEVDRELKFAKQAEFMDALERAGIPQGSMQISELADHPTISFVHKGMAYSLWYKVDPTFGDRIGGEQYCAPHTEAERRTFDKEKREASREDMWGGDYGRKRLGKDFAYSRIDLQGPDLFAQVTKLLNGEAWIGRPAGSMVYLHLPDGNVSDGYHEIFQLSNGAWIGELGSLQFLLRDGQRVSFGYQRIAPAMNGYIARVGSLTCNLDRNGNAATKECRDAAGLYDDRQ